jgi:hypothetical protein
MHFRSLKTWFFTVAAIAAMWAAAVDVFPQTTDGGIAGRVIRGSGPDGVAGVQITLVGPLTGTAANAAASNPLMAQEIAAATATPVLQATTDNAGRFSFGNLREGQYTLQAKREGYFEAAGPGRPGGATILTSMVRIAARQSKTDVVFVMVGGAAVSGTVLDPNGQPVANMPVAAYQISYRDGRAVLDVIQRKTTDDRGHYRIFWVFPGEYFIGANPGPSSAFAYPRTFHPNSVDGRTAPAVLLGDGADADGIDIHMSGSTFKVSGRVIDAPALPGPRTVFHQFYLLPSDPSALVDSDPPLYANMAADQTNGRFELRGVLPGSYDLIATGWGPFPGREHIEVGSQDLENVAVTIRPGVDVKVRILIDGIPVTAPAADVSRPAAGTGNAVFFSPDGQRLVFRNLALNGAPLSPPPCRPSAATPSSTSIRVQLRPMSPYPEIFDSAALSNAVTDGSGALAFAGVPQGMYSLQISALPRDVYIADIRSGGASIYDDGLAVGGESPVPIEVFANSGGETIHGTVRDAAGNNVTSATVVLVPPPPRRQNATLYKSTCSDAAGEFAITGVAPGDYTVFAWDRVPSGAYQNAAFLSTYESRGLGVHVTAGAALTVSPMAILFGQGSK